MNRPGVMLISMLPEIRNLGMLYLAESVRAAGHDAGLLFMTNERAKDRGGIAFAYNVDETDEELDNAVRFVAERKPDIVGLSLMTGHYHRSVALTKRLREVCPNTEIMWGGIHPTLAQEESIQHADSIIVGEAEDAMVEYLRRRAAGESPRDVGSMWFREKDGTIVKNEVRHLNQDLSTLPFPRWDFTDRWCLHGGKVVPMSDDLYRNYMHWRGELYNIMITRGCPYRCTYCCNASFINLYLRKGKLVRRRKVAEAIEELQHARRRFPFLRGIDIQDDSFLMSDDHYIEEFAKVYKREIGIPFYARTIPSYVTEHRIKVLKEAGLDHLQMGLEASERINKEVFRRPVSNRRFIDAAHVFHKFNVTKHYDVILDNPYATEDDYVDILNTLMACPKPYFLSCLSMTFFPYTPIWDRAKKDGKVEMAREGYADGIVNLKSTYLNHLIIVAPMTPTPLMRYFVDQRAKKSTQVAFEAYCKLVVQPYFTVLNRLRGSRYFFNLLKPAYFFLQRLRRGRDLVPAAPQGSPA